MADIAAFVLAKLKNKPNLAVTNPKTKKSR